ncbi:MAG: helix-turn-helix domain-containing protein [Candidatus ainarchaeum sp.]|nr:helix-turn-helix domain-containing protein [Candidatus ainarchaeum sp.]
MKLELLEEIGLTKGEISVYMALLELGPTKIGALAQRAGVSSSKVYKILGRLQKKGLAGYVVREGVKYFSAQPPRRILDYIDEKEKKLDENRARVKEMLPELEEQQKLEKTGATVYEGFRAVTNIFRTMLDELEPGESYCVIGATYGQAGPELRRFFYKFHQLRASKGVVVKMLANLNTKGNLVKTTQSKAEIRFLPQYFASHSQTNVWRGKVAIFMFTRNPTAVVIENGEAAASFLSHFRALWKIARP